MEVPMENYLALADSIVMQAIQDYRILYKRYLKRPHDWKIKSEMEQCRKFLASGWFSTLSGADGVMILERIEQNPDLVIRKSALYVMGSGRKRGRKHGKKA